MDIECGEKAVTTETMRKDSSTQCSAENTTRRTANKNSVCDAMQISIEISFRTLNFDVTTIVR